MTVRARIASFSIALPDDWHVVPARTDDPSAWAASVLGDLVDGGAQPADDGALLTRQLADVAASAAEAGPGTRAAALIRDDEPGLVSAMLALVVRDAPDAAGFLRALVAELEDDPTVVNVAPVKGIAPAGQVVGAQVLSAQAESTDPASGMLEERAVLAVFPRGARQAVVATLITAGLGVVDDAARETHALLGGLTVELAS